MEGCSSTNFIEAMGVDLYIDQAWPLIASYHYFQSVYCMKERKLVLDLLLKIIAFVNFVFEEVSC